MNPNPPNAPSLRRFALEERYESLIIKPPTNKCCDNDNCEKNCESSNVNPPPAPNPKYKRNNSNNDVKNEHIQEYIIF